MFVDGNTYSYISSKYLISSSFNFFILIAKLSPPYSNMSQTIIEKSGSSPKYQNKTDACRDLLVANVCAFKRKHAFCSTIINKQTKLSEKQYT